MRGAVVRAWALVLVLGCGQEKSDKTCSVDISELKVQDAGKLNGVLRVTNNTAEKISLAKFEFTDPDHFHIMNNASGEKIFTHFDGALIDYPPRQLENDFFELGSGEYREFEFELLYSRSKGERHAVYYVGSTPGSDLTLHFETMHDVESCAVHSFKDGHVHAPRDLLPRLLPPQELKSTGVPLSLLD